MACLGYRLHVVLRGERMLGGRKLVEMQVVATADVMGAVAPLQQTS